MTGNTQIDEQESQGIDRKRLFRLCLLFCIFSLLFIYVVHLLKGRVYSGPAYQVQPISRVVGGPDWLLPAARKELARKIDAELGGRPFNVHDREHLDNLSRSLTAKGIATQVLATPLLPGRVKLELVVYRPCARFRRYDQVHLVDGGGGLVKLSLPGTGSNFPWITWGDSQPPKRVGADIKAAVAVIGEIRDGVLPALSCALELEAVDVSNCGYRLFRAHAIAEIRVIFKAPDGHRILCEWGHPPGSRWLRVPLADKVKVARKLLAEYPGFNGLAGVDLRYVNSPMTWIRRR